MDDAVEVSMRVAKEAVAAMREGVRLPIKVVPGASRSGIAGWLGDTLRIRVTAPPEHGKANAAVEALLRELLGLPAGQLKIVAGRSSPRKVVEIVGLSETEVRRRLADVEAR